MKSVWRWAPSAASRFVGSALDAIHSSLTLAVGLASADALQAARPIMSV